MDYSKVVEETIKAIGNFFEKNKKDIGLVVLGGTVVGGATYLVEEEKNKKDVIKAKKDGYEEASNAYEEKMRLQAEEFLTHKKNTQNNKEAYENLLSEYKTYIDKLERENADQNERLEHLQRYYKLRELGSE